MLDHDLLSEECQVQLPPSRTEQESEDRTSRQNRDSGIYHPREIEVEVMLENPGVSSSESDEVASRQNLQDLISQLSIGKGNCANTYHPKYAENLQLFRRSYSANEYSWSYKPPRKRVISSRQYFSLPRRFNMESSECDIFNISTPSLSSRSLFTPMSAVRTGFQESTSSLNRRYLHHRSLSSVSGASSSSENHRSYHPHSTTPAYQLRTENAVHSRNHTRVMVPAPSSTKHFHFRSGSLPTYHEDACLLPPDDFTRCSSLGRRSSLRPPSSRRRGGWFSAVRRLSEEVLFSTEDMEISRQQEERRLKKRQRSVEEKWIAGWDRQLRTAERHWNTAEEQLRRAGSVEEYGVERMGDQRRRLEYLRCRLEMERRMLRACPDSDSPPPSPPPPLSEDQIKMETVSNDTGLPSSQPPSYSSSTHTPDLDFYPTKYNDQTALITRSRDLTGSRDFKGSRDFNMRPSAFSKFTRDPNLDHDPVFAPYQQLPVVDNRSINSLSRDQLNSLSRDHPRDLNSLSRDYMNSLSRDHMNSLSRDPRDRVLSDGAIMKQGLLHSASLPRNQLGGSQISGLVSPPAYNALSPQPCPQTRGYASSMPFLDSDHYNSEKRAARSHSPMSECSRTTNTSRISLAKRAIHNSHRHNSDDQSQHGSSNQDHIDLSHIMQILTTSTNGKLLSSAAGCLQHMAYNHDHMKARIRDVGGIPILVRLLQAEEEVSLSALGALRNLSYGQQNNINKIAIKDAHGVPLLVQLMKTSDNFEIQELITGVFWNLSSSDQVKPQLLRQALEPIVKSIIIPQSGWKGSQIKHELSGELIPCTTVFRNATGCLRNLSSAGLEGRQVMRSCYGLVDSLLFVLRCVHGKNDVDNKAVENSVCILRNLSYRLESEVSPEHKYGQVEDWRSRGLGGGQFKRKDPGDEPIKKKKNTKKHKGKENATPLPEHTNGVGLLWQPSVVRVYLDLLLECSNPETLEGAAGTLQNLTACSWEPAQLLREAVRREKGLSVISSLLRMSNDLVVRSIAVCLRNLASDSKNKELLGQNTLSDLVNRLPGGEGADGITDMTIGAIISTILELVTGSPETARLLKVQNGIPRLVDISRSTDVYSGQCVHVSNRVLAACWEIRDLRKFLKLKGWNIGMLQRLPPTDRTDGLEYDETKNQFKASYNDGLNRPHQNTLTRQRSPGRHLSPDRHRSPTRHLSPHHGRRVLSPSGYDHNTHRAATMGRAMDPSLGYHRPERPFEDYDMARGQSLPARSLPPTHPLNSNYGVADSWV